MDVIIVETWAILITGWRLNYSIKSIVSYFEHFWKFLLILTIDIWFKFPFSWINWFMFDINLKTAGLPYWIDRRMMDFGWAVIVVHYIVTVQLEIYAISADKNFFFSFGSWYYFWNFLRFFILAFTCKVISVHILLFRDDLAVR